MKRTLMIAPNYPLPENSGASMRTMNFVRYFRKHGEVDILCKKSDKEPTIFNSSNFMKEFFVDYSTDKETKKRFGRAIFDKFVRLKSWSTSHYTPENEQTIRTIVIQGDYDFIVCRYLSQAYPLLTLDVNFRQKVILDVDDIITETIYDAETQGLTGLDGLAKSIDKFILRKYQDKCMGFGYILFCSDDDRLKAVGPALFSKTHVVPNVYPGIVLTEGYPCDGYDKIHRMLFVGSLKYTPNSQGLTWFIMEVFPKVLEEFNDFRLLVVGRNPPDEMVRLIQQYPQIELHANVPDIAPFYARCGISVVPLFAGGGTRIKILESGFAKRPVMSTEIGAYGLGMSDGEEVTIFNDSQSFLDKYRRIRGDRVLYGAMTDRLSRFVHQNFSLENFRKAMDVVVKPLL